MQLLHKRKKTMIFDTEKFKDHLESLALDGPSDARVMGVARVLVDVILGMKELEEYYSDIHNRQKTLFTDTIGLINLVNDKVNLIADAIPKDVENE